MSTPEQSLFYDIEEFDRLPKPGPGDWLDERTEFGQPYRGFTKRIKSHMTRPPSQACDTVLLISIGKNGWKSELSSKFLGHIKKTADAFFSPLKVEVYPETISVRAISHRENEFGHPQFLIDELFSAITQSTSRLHRVYARLGITFDDIYPVCKPKSGDSSEFPPFCP